MKIKRISYYFIMVVMIMWSPAVFAKKEAPPQSLKQTILKTSWTHTLKSGKSKKRYRPEVSSPIIFSNKVFIGTHSSYFYALDANNKGKTLWMYESNGPIASKAIADETSVYFGNNKGTVFSLDSETGKKNWDTYVGGEIISEPALSQGRLYVVTTSREVYSLNASTGKEIWSAFIRGFEKKFTMRGNSPVVVSNGRLYIGFADGQVACLSQDGQTVWSKNLVTKNVSFKDIDAAVLVDNSFLYVVGYFGSIAKLSMSNGSVIWSKEAKSGTHLAHDNENIYLTSDDGSVIAFNKESGNRLWDVNLHSGALASPVLVQNYILVGTENNTAYVFEKSSGRVMQILPISAGYLGQPLFQDNKVYLLSTAAKVYVLNLVGQ